MEYENKLKISETAEQLERQKNLENSVNKIMKNYNPLITDRRHLGKWKPMIEAVNPKKMTSVYNNEEKSESYVSEEDIIEEEIEEEA